jgi:hypothetical protein
MFRAIARVSLVTAHSLCQARYGLRSRVVGHGLPFQISRRVRCCLLVS